MKRTSEKQPVTYSLCDHLVCCNILSDKPRRDKRQFSTHSYPITYPDAVPTPRDYPTTLAVTYCVVVRLEHVLLSKPVRPPKFELDAGGGETVDTDVVVTMTVDRVGAGHVDG
jgi:hypothetical protein